MARFIVQEQPDHSWGWMLVDGPRTMTVQVFPGYGSALEAAAEAARILTEPYQHLAVRLALSYEKRN